MKSLTLIFVLLLFLQTAITHSQNQNIYISGVGNDFSGNGSTTAPYKSLERALEAVTSPSSITYNLILKPTSSAIQVSKSGQGSLLWTKSGSVQHPINVYSENGVATLESDRPTHHMIFLEDVSYVNFRNIKFEKATLAVRLDNADYCKIEFCEFVGSPIGGSGGSGTIWIGKIGLNKSLFNDNQALSNQRSDYNIIRNNHFKGSEIIENDKQHLYHAIYVSEGSYGNTIYYNTMKMGIKIGSAIQLNHGYMASNSVSNNFIGKIFGPETDTSKTMNSRHGITFQTESTTEDTSEAQNTTNNILSNNYLYANYNREYANSTACDPNNPSNTNFQGPQLLRVDGRFGYPLCSQNTISNNILAYGDEEFYEDPLWLDYETEKMSNRMVSGDFDGDSIDDVASLYDNGGNNTTLRIWLSSTNSFVLSKGGLGWWNVGGYNANKTTGRMVSGDFDGNGFDDIAAFYDYGNNVTKLHMWLSSGTHITYQGSSGWWNTTGYDSNKITGRVVSGDFDGNGFDDIAAFYDYGNNVTKLHMWLSSGTHITYQGSSGWWNTTGYDSNKITGRVVSGDFDGNGFDDIGAFYDYGNNIIKLHMWLSSGTHITYQNSNGWWSRSWYDANKITGRVVSGDFDGNGYDDIGAFYDYGGITRIHSWLSSGTHITYQGNYGWWGGGYNADKVTGQVVTGDFNNDGKDDISAFYDYSNINGSLRSHVWHSTGNDFGYYNYSLGYPWKSLNGNSGSSKSPFMVEGVETQPRFDNKNYLNVKVSPNPIREGSYLSLQYYLKEESTIKLMLYDIQGRKVKDIRIKRQSKGIHNVNNISLDDISNGTYFLRFETNQITKSFLIIKE